MFPAEQQHPELRAPVADVVVGDDAVAEQAQRARQAVSEDRGADVAHVHRLGHVRRTEINDDGSRLRGFFEKQMFAARGGLAAFAASTEAFSRKFRKPAPAISTFSQTFGNVELGQHVGGELARIHFPHLGERHQRVALVIAEFRVGHGRTRTAETSASGRTARTAACSFSSICLCGSTENYLTTDGHGWTRIKFRRQ